MSRDLFTVLATLAIGVGVLLLLVTVVRLLLKLPEVRSVDERWRPTALRIVRYTCCRCRQPFDDGEMVYRRGPQLAHERCLVGSSGTNVIEVS